MIPFQRREKIVQELQRKKTCTVFELSRLVGVSEATIHRDLVHLDSTGIIEKVHGGATIIESLGENSKGEQRLDLRLRKQVAEKEDIARRAVRLIRDETSIFLDHSSTSIYLAREIRSRTYENLIVITNSVKILNEFDWPSSISVISTGGYLQRQWSALGGAIALDSLSRLNFDQIFISCGGVSIDRGVMTSFTFIVEILRKASGIAREVNLMVDNSKFSKVGTYTIMPVTTLKRIITDEKISQQVADQYRGLGIGVDF